MGCMWVPLSPVPGRYDGMWWHPRGQARPSFQALLSAQQWLTVNKREKSFPLLENKNKSTFFGDALGIKKNEVNYNI